MNVDDLGDHRPGQRAAAERGAAFPLVDAGFTKADVRAWSKELGLETWDKPAAACLASRLPYGTPVTLGRLASVERAEAALRALGFAELRVRHHGDDRPDRGAGRRPRARSSPSARPWSRRWWRPGYRWATLDLAGFRSGGFNRRCSAESASSASSSRRRARGSRWGT